MTAEANKLYHTDVTVRLGALAIVAAFNAIVTYYIETHPTQYIGMLAAPILNNLLLLWLSLICVKTAFTQDFRDIISFELIYLIAAACAFAAANHTNHTYSYSVFLKYHELAKDIFLTTYLARVLSPLKNNSVDDFVNWPVFGPIGLFYSLRWGQQYWHCRPNSKQAIIAYCMLLAAIVIAIYLWHLGIKNRSICYAAVVGVTVTFAIYKTPAAIRTHLEARRLENERVELEKAQILELAQQAEREKAEAEAQAARLTTECEGLQVVVAQTTVEKERASVEAARATEEATLASAEAARLAQANQGLKAVVAKNETAIIYQLEFANKLQEEQAKERARLEQIAADARAEGNIAKLGRLMLRIMNPKHPHYSVRLHASIEMWAHFEDADLRNASPYDALNAWAWDNAKKLGLLHSGNRSKTSVGRCAYVANWDHVGGAPKSEAKVGRANLREIQAENTVAQDCA